MKWIAAHWSWDAVANCWRFRLGYWWKFVAAKPGAAVARIAASPVTPDVCRGLAVAGLGAAGAAFAPLPAQPYSEGAGGLPAPAAPWISGGFGAASGGGFGDLAGQGSPGLFLPSFAPGNGTSFWALPPCCLSVVGLPPDYVITPPGVIPNSPPTQPVAEPATLAILLAAFVTTIVVRRFKRKVS